MCAQEDGQADTGLSTKDEFFDVRSCVVTSNTARKFHFEGTSDSAPSKQGAGTGSQEDLQRAQTESKGDCIIFLEHVRHIPHFGPSSLFRCQAGAEVPVARPRVRIWATLENGEKKPIGKVVQWKARSLHHGEPCWYSAKSLGFNMASATHVQLHVELYDKRRLIGSWSDKLEGLPIHKEIVRELDVGQTVDKPCTISFQVLDSDNVLRPRTVFFVRHGESYWNKAQSELDLWSMAIKKDHPLSNRGRQQAEELAARLEAGTADVEPMIHPDVVYVSPLTRAVQTAVIGFSQGLLKSRGHCEFVLMPNAREKQNLGGRDSMPTKIGADIVQHAHDELCTLYRDSEDAPVLQTFNQLVFDCQEVQDQWWRETHAESHMDLEERLEEFMSQLVFSPHRNIVVVGHSHFFRAVFQKHLSQEFQAKHPLFAQKLAKMKLSNCGIARLDMDPRNDDDGVITNVELLLDTRIGDDGIWNTSCCEAQGLDASEASRVDIVNGRQDLYMVHDSPETPEHYLSTSEVVKDVPLQ